LAGLIEARMGVEWRLDPTHYIEYTLESFTSEMQLAQLAIDHLEVRWGEIWAQTRLSSPSRHAPDHLLHAWKFFGKVGLAWLVRKRNCSI